LDGLLGFDMNGKTVGLIGLGKIGLITAKILLGFGCVVNAYDRIDNPAASAMGVKFISMDELLSTSDIISLHCPLTPDTFHLINDKTLKQTKPGVMIINTSRGGLIDAKAAIRGLKSKQIGYLGLDVYEEESDLFFRNLSEQVLQDDVFMRLESFPNVLITGHQAFFTDNALRNIAQTTADNLRDYAAGKPLVNQVLP
jgi:D-lactate dehydrogenase